MALMTNSYKVELMVIIGLLHVAWKFTLVLSKYQGAPPSNEYACTGILPTDVQGAPNKVAGDVNSKFFFHLDFISFHLHPCKHTYGHNYTEI